MNGYLPFHSPYPEDMLRPELLTWWFHAKETVLVFLMSPKYRRKSYYGSMSGNLLLYPPEILYKDKEMTRGKPKKPVDSPRIPAGHDGQLQWVRAEFNDQDYVELEQSDASVELLAARLIGLVADGYGCTVKFNAERGEFNCTIYRPPVGNQRVHIGLSGWSPDLRDAILATLYRFDVKCGGILNDELFSSSPNQPSRRFR